MLTEILSRTIATVATVILASLLTATAAIAASGIGHALGVHPTVGCGAACHYSLHQTRPAHVAKASASVAMQASRR